MVPLFVYNKKRKIMSNLKNSKLLDRISLKHLKIGFGHDLAGMYVDFYLDGKKMGFFNDDGWGGEADIRFDNATCETIFKAFLIDNKVAEIIQNEMPTLFKTVGDVDFDFQISMIVEDAVSLLEEKKSIAKFQKEIEKACAKGIVFGTDTSFRHLSYKIPLAQLVSIYKENGVATIQKTYEKAKASLAPGERILNKNLEELGIKL